MRATGKQKKGVRENDVVVLPSGPGLKEELEAAGIRRAPGHQAVAGMTGTVVKVERGMAWVAAAGEELPWPAALLTPSSSLPPGLYDRNLLNQVKLRRGKALKALREELHARPAATSRFNAGRVVELENEKQRKKMMWAQEARSRTRHVGNLTTHLSTYTNPTGSGVIPQYSPPVLEPVQEEFSLAWKDPLKVATRPLPSLPPPVEVPIPPAALTAPRSVKGE